MQLDTLLIFLFSASILTLSPGPDIIYVFLKSSTDGKIAGIKTVLGLTTGLFFHTILLIEILLVLKKLPIFLDCIRPSSFKFLCVSHMLISKLVGSPPPGA